MLKLAALMGIVAGCGLGGILKAAELKERIRLLDEFFKMILSLKSEINYFREPLAVVLGRQSHNEDTEASRLLREIQHRMNTADDAVQIWRKAVLHIYGGTAATAEDRRLFQYPGGFLGQTDCENHLFHFEHLENLLQGQLQEARVSYQVKGPLFSKLGFFIGGMVAVLLM